MKLKFDKKEIKNFFKKISRFLVEKSFFTLIFIFFLVIVVGILVFLKFSKDIKNIGISQNVTKFEEEKYQKVFEDWQKKEKKIEEINFKIYLNPFEKRY